MQKRVRVEDDWVLARGQKVHGPRWFRVEEYLGRGSFAAAYRVTNADGEEFFLKEYLPPEYPEQLPARAAMYRQERRVLMRVSGHEFCPTLHAAFSECGSDYLVQDFVRGRDMEEVLASGERRGEARILRWAVCLTRAVAHLHAQGIAHQDLKPGNVRLNRDDDPVLLDFGAARDFTLPEESAGEYGTDGYMPPERVQDAGAQRSRADELTAGRLADVFALGAILVEAMTGQRLSQDEINAQKERLFGALIHSATLPTEFVHAVFKALAYDPRQRYGSAVAMLADLLPIAPPVGRVDRLFLDFGRTELGTPLRQSLLAYNAGGGRLQGVVEVDADWLHLSWPGAPPAARRPFDNDRQPVTITALPERVPRHGTPTEAEVRFIFPSGLTRVRCSIERPALPASIRVTPTCLRIRPHPLGRSVAGLTFRNEGEVAAIIALHASPPNGIRIEPAELELEAGAEGTVLAIWHPVSSQAEHLREWLHAGRHSLEGRTPPVAPGASVPPVEYLLEWLIDGLPGGFIPVEVVTIGSLARSVLNRFRRPDAGDELRVSRQSCRDEQ